MHINNYVYEGDCLDILPNLPAKSVDLILSDLPYGITSNPWDKLIPLDQLWKCYKHILKPRGAIVLTCYGVFTASLILSNVKWFRYKLIWIKSKATNFLNVNRQPLRKYEDICVFYKQMPTYNPQISKGEPYHKHARERNHPMCYRNFKSVDTKNDGIRYPSDILYFKTAESEPDQEFFHTSQKPIELAKYLIRTYTNPGDIVLDNACGSGSFLVAAHLEKRRFCGIEKNENVHRIDGTLVDCINVIEHRLRSAGANPVVVRK